MNLPAIRAALDRDDRDRTECFGEAMGWGGGLGEARRQPAPGRTLALSLGGYPTSAGLLDTDRNQAPRTLWLAGLRYGVAPLRNELLYINLDRRQQWRARADQLDEQVLRGFTPEGFAQLGRFEPRTQRGLEPLEFPPPDEAASLFIGGWLERQLDDYLRQHAAPEAWAEAQRAFVHFAAALLLLRTIEDLEVLDWLPRGALRQAAGNPERLAGLMDRAAEKLNSRVLGQSGREVLKAADFVARMVRSAYEGEMGEVDFAALDVDPVGRFFELLLGRSRTRTEDPQMNLLERGVTVHSDATEQRRTGSYYTPRLYADTLARRLVTPELRLARSTDELPIILDLAAGSGELLCAALREMLSLPRWRTVEAVREVLERRIFAVDKQGTALQLCALNLLRTAIRSVPDLLKDPRKLPPLTANFIEGDALSRTVADRLPEADVTLINPPFAPDRAWREELTDPVEAVAEVGKPGNLAMAFLVTAVQKTRHGGFIGAVLPSNQFSTPQGRPWRTWTAERVAIDTVVANYAEIFAGTQSYAGFILGRKLEVGQTARPRTRYLKIDGRARFAAIDPGAWMSGGDRPELTSTLSGPLLPERRTWEWQVSSAPEIHVPGLRVPLARLTYSEPHEGIRPAPEPWGRELFLFDDIGRGRLRHRATGQEIERGDSPRFRPTAWPRALSLKVPIWSEPVVPGLRIFHPGDQAGGVSLEALAQDGAALRAAEIIQGAVLAQSAAGRDAARFRTMIEKGLLAYIWLKEYREGAQPLVFISKASRSAVGRQSGIALSAWINEDGSVIPIEGIQFRVEAIEAALVLAVWLSLDEVVDRLRSPGSQRNMDTFQISPLGLGRLEVPDPNASRWSADAQELAELVTIYRAEVDGQAEKQACAHPLFREIQALGRSFWQ